MGFYTPLYVLLVCLGVELGSIRILLLLIYTLVQIILNGSRGKQIRILVGYHRVDTLSLSNNIIHKS
jgi:hypothetical protein